MSAEGAALSGEQRTVAEASPDKRILVTAGPGTGKTHTLVARLVCLTDKYGLAPGSEVLVLSFTRSAVHEIRKRAQSVGGDARYVRATTFDSFATRLLSEVSPDGPWTTQSYDGRIVAATEAIRDSDEAGEFLEDVSHVVLDEIQDLVGVREEMVKAILERVDAGFTVFGDPAQAIYNFQLTDPVKRAEGSKAFFRWLRRTYSDDLEEISFGHNYRATTSAAGRGLRLGEKIAEASIEDYKALWDETQETIRSLPPLGKIQDGTAPRLLKGIRGRTALLCRTNGQALMCSRRLWEAEAPNFYSRGALDRAVPRWLGVLFGKYAYETISITRFSELALQILGPSTDWESLWGALMRLDPTPGRTLALRRVAERISVGSVPDDLLELPEADLVVSTIHRAKGQEFDNVLVAVGADDDAPEQFAVMAEEVRVRYVALTRPIKLLMVVGIPPFRGVFHHRKSDRWVRRLGRYASNDFEVMPDDIAREPAGASEFENVDPAYAQDYIAREVHVGDPLSLHLADYAKDGSERAFYAVVHEGTTVGVTTEAFAEKLYAFLKLWPAYKVAWPDQIGSLRVDGVDTVAGNPLTGRKHGLGETGLWLRVRASGFGSLQIPRYERGHA